MKLLMISLGCDKNLVDSEEMLALLCRNGYELTDEEEEAEIIVINTCCFIHDAKEESIETILEMARYKEEGCLKVLVAAGCLAERYREEIRREIPEVDAVIGTASCADIISVIREALEGKKIEDFKDINTPFGEYNGRVITTGGYYSYLKIAEGCDKCCTYCIIPKIRGNYRSVPMERLLLQAGELAGRGVTELNLVAQETTLYGVDLYGKKMLPELLKRLCGVEGLKWIRVLYCYPEEITEELIEVIASEKKLCRYLDIPIQHASDRILKRMGRRASQSKIREQIRALRERIPDITLRTTFITGFPGETEEDFEELLAFTKEMRFDRLGVFTYSAEEGTPAALMEDQTDEDLKKERRNRIMEAQQEIAFAKAREKIGKTAPVLIEGRLAEEGVYVGRTQADAPNVDGYLFVPCGYELLSGDIVDVRITDAKGYDLYGEIISQEDKNGKAGRQNEFTE